MKKLIVLIIILVGSVFAELPTNYWKSFAVEIDSIALYKFERDALLDLLKEKAIKIDSLEAQKPRYIQRPAMVEFVHFCTAPYGSDDPIPALAAQRFQSKIDSVIRWQIDSLEMTPYVMRSGRLLIGMTYRSAKYDGVFTITGMTNFPEGVEYDAWAYPPFEYLGWEGRYIQIDTCQNFALELRKRESEPIEIHDTIVEVYKIRTHDTIVIDTCLDFGKADDDIVPPHQDLVPMMSMLPSNSDIEPAAYADWFIWTGICDNDRWRRVSQYLGSMAAVYFHRKGSKFAAGPMISANTWGGVTCPRENLCDFFGRNLAIGGSIDYKTSTSRATVSLVHYWQLNQLAGIVDTSLRQETRQRFIAPSLAFSIWKKVSFEFFAIGVFEINDGATNNSSVSLYTRLYFLEMKRAKIQAGPLLQYFYYNSDRQHTIAPGAFISFFKNIVKLDGKVKFSFSSEIDWRNGYVYEWGLNLSMSDLIRELAKK